MLGNSEEVTWWMPLIRCCEFSDPTLVWVKGQTLLTRLTIPSAWAPTALSLKVEPWWWLDFFFPFWLELGSLKSFKTAAAIAMTTYHCWERTGGCYLISGGLKKATATAWLNGLGLSGCSLWLSCYIHHSLNLQNVDVAQSPLWLAWMFNSQLGLGLPSWRSNVELWAKGIAFKAWLWSPRKWMRACV